MIRAALALLLLLTSSLAAAPTEDQALSTTVTFAIPGDVVQLQSKAAVPGCVFLGVPMSAGAIFCLGGLAASVAIAILWALLRWWFGWVARD